jgi:hypothetical protein
MEIEMISDGCSTVKLCIFHCCRSWEQQRETYREQEHRNSFEEAKWRPEAEYCWSQGEQRRSSYCS